MTEEFEPVICLGCHALEEDDSLGQAEEKAVADKWFFRSSGST
jgi:hypothetical protein